MILTDYYKFSHLPMSKSEMKRDGIVSTQSYTEFKRKDSQLFVYFFSVPMKFKCYAKWRVNKVWNEGRFLLSLY